MALLVLHARRSVASLTAALTCCLLTCACSACHVSWYCGTACSHADWREGGHRRVCKLLGEERGRRKAAAAAHAREE